jgi:hypothetical protein
METLATIVIVGWQPRPLAPAPKAAEGVRLEDIFQRAHLPAYWALDEEAAQACAGIGLKPELAIWAVVCAVRLVLRPDVPREFLQMAFSACHNKTHRHDEGSLA